MMDVEFEVQDEEMEADLEEQRKESEIAQSVVFSTKDDEDDDSPNAEDNVAADSGNGSIFEPPSEVDVEVEESVGEIDSDAAFGNSDVEKYKGFLFRGSSAKSTKTNVKNGLGRRPVPADFMSDSEDEVFHVKGSDGESLADDEGVDGQLGDDARIDSSDAQEVGAENGMRDSDEQDLDSDEGSEASTSAANEVEADEKARRDELRKIMSEEQKTVVATISQAARADVDKGNAVKQQRKTFDSLLNVRMQLQKALIASNSMSAIDDDVDEENLDEPYKAAEESALKLWNTLNDLRHTLNADTATTGQKRRHTLISTDTPSTTIWLAMQTHESQSLPNRHAILEKWSSKIKASKALPVSRGLNPLSSQQQSITTVLQDYLSDSTKLIERTRIPRSCAPVQARSKAAANGVEGIYDDADWYQLLLQELISSKRSSYNLNPTTNSTTNSINTGTAFAIAEAKPMYTLLKEAKTRKVVDTKASKGRKLRYGVHEKLVSFMAREDRRAWEDGAVERFFAGLLGRKGMLEEDDRDMDEEDMDVDGDGVALRLFRS